VKVFFILVATETGRRIFVCSTAPQDFLLEQTCDDCGSIRGTIFGSVPFGVWYDDTVQYGMIRCMLHDR
jgi:hypothetical protein